MMEIGWLPFVCRPPTTWSLRFWQLWKLEQRTCHWIQTFLSTESSRCWMGPNHASPFMIVIMGTMHYSRTAIQCPTRKSCNIQWLWVLITSWGRKLSLWSNQIWHSYSTHLEVQVCLKVSSRPIPQFWISWTGPGRNFPSLQRKITVFWKRISPLSTLFVRFLAHFWRAIQLS